MGRIDLTEIVTGDACDLTVANNMVNAITSGHSSINGQNIRRGGLDERNFSNNAITSRPSGTQRLVIAGGGPVTAGQPGNAPAALGATYDSSGAVLTPGIPVTIGPIRHQPLTFLDRLVVKISFLYEANRTSNGDSEFVFQLGFATDAVVSGSTTWTLIDSTKRVAGVYDQPSKGSVTISHRVINGFPSPTDTAHFGLFVWDQQPAGGDGTVTIKNLNFYAISYLR